MTNLKASKFMDLKFIYIKNSWVAKIEVFVFCNIKFVQNICAKTDMMDLCDDMFSQSLDTAILYVQIVQE